MMVAGSVMGGLISWRAAALTSAILAVNGVIRVVIAPSDGAPPGAMAIRRHNSPGRSVRTTRDPRPQHGELE